MTVREQAGADLWSGVDLSGVTLVIGLGTGQLLQLLAEEAQRAGGIVVLASYLQPALAAVAELAAHLPVERVCCRPRELPLADGTVDLCVVNASLREVPLPHYRTFLDELWRVLVPGGHLRISDVLAPTDAPTALTWRRRCDLITRLGQALGRPVALHADARALAIAMQEVGYESMAVSLLPGVSLTSEWLGETVEAIRAMVSRVSDAELRQELLERELPALIAAFQRGDQRAADRFVVRGNKVGNLALDMETAGTAEVLAARDDEGDALSNESNSQ
ncbi:MAG: class I SAM-dependent methyltransferase [Anaerolineae bacterium]|jgi:SAM-dependent methyltransferase